MRLKKNTGGGKHPVGLIDYGNGHVVGKVKLCSQFALRQGVCAIWIDPPEAELRYWQEDGVVMDHWPLVVELYDCIFGKQLLVGFGAWKEVSAMFRLLSGNKDDSVCPQGLTNGLCLQFDDGRVGIWVEHSWSGMAKPFNVAGLAHEALHATDLVLRTSGMTPHRANEELRAYYQQWITETMAALLCEDSVNWAGAGVKVGTLQ